MYMPVYICILLVIADWIVTAGIVGVGVNWLGLECVDWLGLVGVDGLRLGLLIADGFVVNISVCEVGGFGTGLLVGDGVSISEDSEKFGKISKVQT